MSFILPLLIRLSPIGSNRLSRVAGMASQSRPPVSKPSKGSGGGSRSTKPRGRAGDDAATRLSKSLSYILRHGAQKEGLDIRSDGYLKLADLLAHRQFRGSSFTDIKRAVDTNDKKRYQMLFVPATAGSTPSSPCSSHGSMDIERPAVANTDESTISESITTGPDGSQGTWWIRANQGHSIKVEALELKEVTSPDEIPIAIHGTNRQAWNSISFSGLSRMQRNHIHLASGKPGSNGVLSGMRASSEILVYVDVKKAMAAGIKFSVSENGVILCAGDERGYIQKQFFARVERMDGTEVKY